MKKVTVRSVVYLISAIVGLVWLVLGIKKYGVWHEHEGPIAGFFPSIIGAALIIFSVIAFLQSLRQEPPKFAKEAFMVLGSLGFILILTYVFGMLFTLLCYYIGWLLFVEHYPWKRILVTTTIYGSIIYGIFVIWLSVPFPKGLLHSLMFL